MFIREFADVLLFS
jgi:hypothetical protein